MLSGFAAQSIKQGLKMLRYCFFVITFCLLILSPVFANSYDVLVQESPAGSGVIQPGPGVHTFNNNESISLTTAPNPGYHFVGWLGDVMDPAANRTSMIVDGPKIIIAVFERDQFEALEDSGPQISVGPPGLYPRSDSYTNSNSVSGSEREHHGDDDDDGGDDSDDDDDPVPVPTPEPATMLLLGIGGWFIAKNRTK